MSGPAITNFHVSSAHAAIMETELKAAQSRAELERIAERHVKFLLGKDKDAMREAFRRRAAAIRES